MEILVCFKIVPDYEEIPEADWENILNLDMAYVKKMYGCFDEAALEMALCLKEELKEAGEKASCTALTIGTGPKILFTGLYAAGFDRVIRIGGNLEEFVTQKTAGMLANCIRRLKPDLILTGHQTGASNSGMTAALLSAALSVPWVFEVTKLHMERQTGKILVTCEQEKAHLVRRMDTPFVLSIGNTKKSRLQMFSLKARMEAAKKPVLEESAEEPEEVKKETVPGRLLSKKREKACNIIEGTGSKQLAGALYEVLTGRRQEQ